MKSGIICYDAKHDSYFIQSGRAVFSLFCFSIDDSQLGAGVMFTHSPANEVITLEFQK